MSDRHPAARIVVIWMWWEPPHSLRVRIVDGAERPGAEQHTVAASSVDAGLSELGRILRAFAAQPGRPVGRPDAGGA